MPILTPTFPHQNSTFNVTNNTLRLIREKMCVASEICSNIKLGSETWEALFQVFETTSGVNKDLAWLFPWTKLNWPFSFYRLVTYFMSTNIFSSLVRQLIRHRQSRPFYGKSVPWPIKCKWKSRFKKRNIWRFKVWTHWIQNPALH